MKKYEAESEQRVMESRLLCIRSYLRNEFREVRE